MASPARGPFPVRDQLVARWPRPGAYLTVLQAAVALLSLALCCRGQGCPAYWLALAAALPALRCLLSPDYRRGVRAWLTARWRQVEAYPVQSMRLPWLAVLTWVVAPSVGLLALSNVPIVSGDCQPVMLTAASLVKQGDWDLSEYVDAYPAGSPFSPDGTLPYFLRRTPSGVHSAYPSGMVAFALPAAAAARLLGANLDEPQVRTRLEKWTACWVAGLCLGLFFLLLLHLARPGPAWALTAILATGSALYSTVGQGLWQHGGAIFWGLLALLVEFRHTARPAAATPLLQGLACALMLACRLSSALFVAPLGLWLLVRSPRRAVAVAAVSAAAFAPWALLNLSLYGNPAGASTGQLHGGHWFARGVEAPLGVLFSPARGLLVYQPWLLLLGGLALPSVRRRLTDPGRGPCPRGWVAFAVAFGVLHLAVISAWACWWGGDCWGSRLAAEVVPLFGLLCVAPLAALWQSRGGRAAVLGLALASALLHLPAIYLGSMNWSGVVLDADHLDRLWSWPDAPFLYPLRHGRH
jgi:hypothetical protein